MSCVVPDCKRNQKNSPGTHFARCNEQTLEKIKKIRNDPLPKKKLICEDHFSPDCFKIINGRFSLFFFNLQGIRLID